MDQAATQSQAAQLQALHPPGGRRVRRWRRPKPHNLGRVPMKQRYMSFVITLVTGCALVAVMTVGLGAPSAAADGTYHNLAAGPFSQGWATDGLITVNDNWSGVPSVLGYEGRMSPSMTDLDPQTVLT